MEQPYHPAQGEYVRVVLEGAATSRNPGRNFDLGGLCIWPADDHVVSVTPISPTDRLVAVLEAHTMLESDNHVSCKCGFSAARYGDAERGQLHLLPAYRHYRAHVAVALAEVVER